MQGERHSYAFPGTDHAGKTEKTLNASLACEAKDLYAPKNLAGELALPRPVGS